MKRIAALAALVLLSGCATKGPAVPTVTAPATEAGTTAQETDVNDLAFRLIKEKRWPEAVEAAQKAVARDAGSSAAHFNLGRALLGSGRAGEAVAEFDRASELTKGANADVEYFHGQALVAAKQKQRAAEVWLRALTGPLSGDAEITAALKEVLPQDHLAAAVGDVNADGKLDLLQVNTDRFVITSGAGGRLYDGPIQESGLKGISHRIAIYPVSEGAPLIHVEIPACPSAPLNAFYWYDGKKITAVGDTQKGPCLNYNIKDGGILEEGFKASDVYYVSRKKFEKGEFKAIGGAVRLTWPARQERIGYLLESVYRTPMETPGDIFTSLQTYEELRARTAQGRWEFQQGGEIGPDFVQVKPVQDGKTLGIANVYLQKDANGNVKITRIVWP